MDTKLTLVLEPNPILHTKAEKISNITPELNDILNKMGEIMQKFNGIGLAAPQVGISKQLIIIDAETIAIEEHKVPPKNKFLKIINPEIISISDEKCIYEEGCLSLPTIYYNVERSKFIEIKFKNELNEEILLKADGLLARCIQHEIDHLYGKVFIDYISPFKRKLALNKLKKITSKK